MNEIIKELKERLEIYKEELTDFDVDNMDLERTEDYGYFLGKRDLLEELIPKFEKLND